MHKDKGDSRMSKKSQISMFMIIGLVLLIIIGVTIFIVKTINVRKPTTREQVKISDEVKAYTTECLKKVGIEALRKAGEQGGYIYPKKCGIHAIKMKPTNSNAFIYLGKEMPYWVYMDQPCSVVLKIPSLDEGVCSIKNQVEQYIEENIDECLNDYEGIEKQGWNISHKKPEVNIIFGEDDTNIKLKMETSISKENEKVIIDKYETSIDIPFRNIYEYAQGIAESEALDGKIASNLMDFIRIKAMNKEIPPVVDTSIKIGYPSIGKIYTYPQVKNVVEETIANNIQLMTTPQSMNYLSGIALTNITMEEVDYKLIKERMTYHSLELTQYPVYTYTIWNKDMGLDLKISPGGYVYMPTITKLFPPNFGLFNLFPSMYVVKNDHYYTMALPVVISLYYPSILDGYTFNFGIESNIINNKPVSLLSNCTSGSYGESLTIDPYTNGGKELTLHIKDCLTNESIRDFFLEYNCGSQSIPLIVNHSKTVLPSCLNGELVIKKDGYEPKTIEMNSNYGEREELSINICPEKNINVSIEMLMMEKSGVAIENPFQNIGSFFGVTGMINNYIIDKIKEAIAPYWEFSGSINTVPKKDEYAIIIFKPKQGYERAVILNNTNPIQELSITPGEYEIETMYFHSIGENYSLKKLELQIPDEYRCLDAALHIDCKGPEKIDINNTIIIGGSISNLTITPEDLRDHKELIIRTIVSRIEDFTTIDDLKQMTSYRNISLTLPDLVKPEWR